MVKLELNDKQVGVHRASYDACIRQIGRELDRIGTAGLAEAMGHLSELLTACRELEAAVAVASQPSIADPPPTSPVLNGHAAAHPAA